MMTDVFLRLAPQNPLRLHLAGAVYARWKEEPNIRLHTVWMFGTFPAFSESAKDVPGACEVELPQENFCWASRSYAEDRAKSDPYILADDDLLILGENWVERAIAIANDNPDFVLLSDQRAIYSERIRGTNINGYILIGMASVGANLVHRKGIIDYRNFEGPANMQDQIVCEHIRKSGLNFGTMKDVISNHLGFGYSQVQPKLWNRY